MRVVQQRKMENMQNTIPEKQQAEAIQQVAIWKTSGKYNTKDEKSKEGSFWKKTCRTQQTKEGRATRGKLFLFATIFYTKHCLGRNTTIGSIHCLFE